MDQTERRISSMYKLHKEVSETLTKFFDLAEETLINGEGMESALEYIGIKSDELLQKL